MWFALREAEGRILVPQGRGVVNGELTFNGDRGSAGKMRTFQRWMVVMIVQQGACI